MSVGQKAAVSPVARQASRGKTFTPSPARAGEGRGEGDR